MPIQCSPFGCNNRQGMPNEAFYRFPADPELRIQWVATLNCKNWQPTPTSRLSSAHLVEGKVTF